MSFKLLAIRPLDGCGKSYIKVLAVGEIYQFYNNYKFHRKKGKGAEILKIEKLDSGQDELYYANRKGQPNVSVSAIVGKNGSGKSSIVELLYVAAFNIALKLQALPEVNSDGEQLKSVSDIKVEIYFAVDEKYFKLVVKDDAIGLSKQGSDKMEFESAGLLSSKKDLELLFYSIIINYSHYALNSEFVGDWVRNIFHKNDGYQTPIVLNPFRNQGNINVNTEEYLTRSRLIANLFKPSRKKEPKVLAPNRVVDKIKFTLNPSKTAYDSKNRVIEELLIKHRDDILDMVFRIMSNKPLSGVDSENRNINVAYKYIVKKLLTISRKYTPYQRPEFYFLKNVESKAANSKKKEIKLVFDESCLKSYLTELKDDESHITFKLRQAINFIHNFSFYKGRIGRLVNIEEFIDHFKLLKSKQKLIDLVPPSFFDFDITFKSGGHFNALSSGEKQKIFGSATLLYHLANINSVRRSGKYVKYRHVNVICDEIELYYHPELQRTYIKDVLDSLDNADLSAIAGINLLFITHSPFILSDIPKSNILFLEDNGMPSANAVKTQTFGANIHDLLKESFFLQDGYIGEFAKKKINETIRFIRYHKISNELDVLNSMKSKDTGLIEALKEERKEIELDLGKPDSVENRNKHKQLIMTIGEPLIQIKLSEMYDEVFEGKTELQIIEKKIEELQQRANQLK